MKMPGERRREYTEYWIGFRFKIPSPKSQIKIQNSKFKNSQDPKTPNPKSELFWNLGLELLYFLRLAFEKI